MIAGIVLLALGLKKAELAVDEPLKDSPSVCSVRRRRRCTCLAHIVFRYRNVGSFNRHRALATVVVLALIPLALKVDALLAVGGGHRGAGRPSSHTRRSTSARPGSESKPSSATLAEMRGMLT